MLAGTLHTFVDTVEWRKSENAVQSNAKKNPRNIDDYIATAGRKR